MSDDGDYDQDSQSQDDRNSNIYVPPGARNRDKHCFGDDFEAHFKVPTRLADKAHDLVEAVNDFHFAMINDTPRNEFYRECLRRAIVPGVSVVLEIGTGSGLLAMIAARLGAKKVVAIEASTAMAELARRNIAANGLADVVTVLENLSTDVTAEDIRAAVRGGKPAVASINAATVAPAGMGDLPDVLVSELFGTLLLGESVLDYVRDAQERLVSPGARVVPPRGVQHAAIVECADVEAFTSAQDWGGFSLRHVNVLQDTASLVFTKQYGFRFSSVESRRLAPPLPVFAVDFSRDGPGFMPRERRIPFSSTEAGTAHCVMVYWDVMLGAPNPVTATRPASETVFEPHDWEDSSRPLVMSTCPIATKDNFARDMQWGQALQLLEDGAAAQRHCDEAACMEDAAPQPPTPFVVRAGEALELEVRLSSDSVVLQFEIHRKAEDLQKLTHLRFNEAQDVPDSLAEPL